MYDIAHRIEAHFGKAPRFVYLHAGTRTGAQVFNISGDSFDPTTLPKAFSRLVAPEIEDCLCIYKDKLRDDHGQVFDPTTGISRGKLVS